MSPALRPLHQEARGLLSVELFRHVTQRKGGKVYFAPIDVILPGVADPVQPDVLFITHERLDIVQETRIEGIPDLIIEILSPGNEQHDRRTKFGAYARAGVPEYWIVDPQAKEIEVYVLRGQAYALLGTFAGRDVLRSEVLLELSVAANDVFP